MIRREVPKQSFLDSPCLIVATSYAKGVIINEYPPMRYDGYVNLKDANAFIRQNVCIKKRSDFRRGERPLLKEMDLPYSAIILVKGHFVYWNKGTYYSFFDNDEDEVVTVWEIRE